MKKIIISTLAALGTAGLFALNASAVAVDNTSNPGGTLSITINTTAIPTAKSPLLFTPSSKVVVYLNSEETCYAISGYQDTAAGKEAAQAYGTACDTNKMYVNDISKDETPKAQIALPAAGTNTAGAFSANNWVSM